MRAAPQPRRAVRYIRRARCKPYGPEAVTLHRGPKQGQRRPPYTEGLNRARGGSPSGRRPVRQGRQAASAQRQGDSTEGRALEKVVKCVSAGWPVDSSWQQCPGCEAEMPRLGLSRRHATSRPPGIFPPAVTALAKAAPRRPWRRRQAIARTRTPRKWLPTRACGVKIGGRGLRGGARLQIIRIKSYTDNPYKLICRGLQGGARLVGGAVGDAAPAEPAQPPEGVEDGARLEHPVHLRRPPGHHFIAGPSLHSRAVTS